jgi:predicted transposase YdaD
LYVDLVYASLSEAAREELQKMNSVKYEYQSEFARRYVAQGRVEGKAEGKAEGRAELVLRQLTVRFGELSAEDQIQVRQAGIDELDAIGVRLLTAETVRQALWSR